jgi:hypothetical protein
MKKILLLFIVTISGCLHSDKLPTAAVTGIVKVDGQPMEGVTVIFNPTADGNAAVGTTDQNGAFKLMTPGGAYGKGTLPGGYIPTFTKDEFEKFEAASQEEYAKKYGNRQPKATHHIPVKYAHPQTCGVASVTVEKGKKNHFEFELSTK